MHGERCAWGKVCMGHGERCQDPLTGHGEKGGEKVSGPFNPCLVWYTVAGSGIFKEGECARLFDEPSEGRPMPATLDLTDVRRFTDDLNDRLRRCENGEGMICSSLDESINYYDQLCGEMRAYVN